MYEWDFSKLPVSIHGHVIELVEKNEWRKLVDIHDQYNLSRNSYCCSLADVKRKFISAIKTGIINEVKET